MSPLPKKKLYTGTNVYQISLINLIEIERNVQYNVFEIAL